eukprot:376471-Amphidinium_carterae.1
MQPPYGETTGLTKESGDDRHSPTWSTQDSNMSEREVLKNFACLLLARAWSESSITYESCCQEEQKEKMVKSLLKQYQEEQKEKQDQADASSAVWTLGNRSEMKSGFMITHLPSPPPLEIAMWTWNCHVRSPSELQINSSQVQICG